MKPSARQIVYYSSLIVVGTYFLCMGLAKAKPFLAPLSIALLLTLLMVPLCAKLEAWGIKKGWAAFFCDAILLAFFIGLFFMISAQVQTVTKDWPEIKEKLEPRIDQVQEFIALHTNMSPAEQTEKIKEKIPGDLGQSAKDDSSGQGNPSSELSISSAMINLFGFLGTSLLTFVYIFFFLLYRQKFRASVMRFFSPIKKSKAEEVIDGAVKVSQRYLLGKLLLTIILAVLYAVGLLVSGVQHAILISLIAAVLSLIPFIGNIIGFGIALAIGFLTAGGGLIGIAVTFIVAQFIESYVLAPYVVGRQVDIHPIFTIVGAVLGGHIWGIVGMIIAVPIVGILKVIFDHVPSLNPLGYFLGEQTGHSSEHDDFLKKVYKKIKGGIS